MGVALSVGTDTFAQELKFQTFRMTGNYEVSFDGQPVLLEKGAIVRAQADENVIKIPVLEKLKGEPNKRDILGWVVYPRNYESGGKKIFELAGDAEPTVEFLKGVGTLYDFENDREPYGAAWPPKGSKLTLKQTTFVQITDHAGKESLETIAVVGYSPYKADALVKGKKKTVDIKGGVKGARHQDLFARDEEPDEIPKIPIKPVGESLKTIPTKPAEPPPQTTEPTEAVADPLLCAECNDDSKLNPLPEKEVALAEIRKIISPLVGIHIGNCKQPLGMRMENSLLLKGLRNLKKRASTDQNLIRAIKNLNKVNAKRLANGEKIKTEGKARVPPPQLRTNYNVSDLLAVDVCARTCMAEMGGQIPSRKDGNMCRTNDRGEFDPTYQMAVVANINNRKRKTFSDSHSPRNEPVSENPYGNFADDTNDPIMQDPFINVVLKPWQYSNWLTTSGQQLNHSRSLCPPNPNGENLIPGTKGPGADKFYAGGAYPYQPIQELDRLSFENCTRQCTDAVFNPDDFWKRTKDFDKLYYASPPNFPPTARAQYYMNPQSGLTPVCPASYERTMISKSGKKVTRRFPDLRRCVVGYPRSLTITTIDGKPLDKLRCMTFGNEERAHKQKPWVDVQ